MSLAEDMLRRLIIFTFVLMAPEMNANYSTIATTDALDESLVLYRKYNS
jgi:hypothetical protein